MNGCVNDLRLVWKCVELLEVGGNTDPIRNPRMILINRGWSEGMGVLV